MKTSQHFKEFNIHSAAESRLRSIGEDLLKRRVISKYTLKTDDGVIFTAIRKSDAVSIRIDIHSGGEVFIRTFDNSYSNTALGYKEDEQLEILKDLLDDIQFFMVDKKYYEEIYKQNGRVVFKKLIYLNGGEETSSKVFAGRLRRFFGSTKETIYPV